MVTIVGAACFLLISILGQSYSEFNRIVPPWQQYFSRVMNVWEAPKAGRQERVRAGEGRYRMLPRGAELICEFPPSIQMMSNVIWERADLGALKNLDQMYKSVGSTRQYSVVSTPRGSTLLLHSLSQMDRGLYRCIATALEPKTKNIMTLFQDVPFYPDISLANKNFPLRPPCCRTKYYNDFYRLRSYSTYKSFV